MTITFNNFEMFRFVDEELWRLGSAAEKTVFDDLHASIRYSGAFVDRILVLADEAGVDLNCKPPPLKKEAPHSWQYAPNQYHFIYTPNQHPIGVERTIDDIRYTRERSKTDDVDVFGEKLRSVDAILTVGRAFYVGVGFLCRYLPFRIEQQIFTPPVNEITDCWNDILDIEF